MEAVAVREVENISNSNIQVVNLTGITPYTYVSLGTWGNKSEHTGLWYDLEEYFKYHYGSYSGAVSISMNLTSSQLNTINSFAINHDTWTLTYNCSSFARDIWNSVSSIQLSTGIINTPYNLANSIKSVSGYRTGLAFPYNYVVYYANGTGAPRKSTIYVN